MQPCFELRQTSTEVREPCLDTTAETSKIQEGQFFERVIKPLVFALLIVLAFGCLNAQEPTWEPSPGHTQLPLWPRAVPNLQSVGVLNSDITKREDSLIALRPWIELGNVTRPTMTVYSPKGSNTGAAVVVFPGGGYQFLAIDLEGTEACDWLTSLGITSILLKYRVPGEVPYSGSAFPKSGPYPKSPMALEDAQRAVGLVRLHAAEWHIDPHKIGVLGFSAGGHLAAAMSTHFEQRVYTPIDAADKESCRPDFAVLVYPGHLSIPPNTFDLNPDIRVTSQTPPTFLLQAEDDPVDGVENSLVYYAALRKAGVPVEMHLYAHGGHAFGLRRTNFAVTEWPDLLKTWLKTIGMISE